MKIQIISGRKYKDVFPNVTISDYSKPVAFDSYDINIIDLSCEGLWRCDGYTRGFLNDQDDLKSISVMLQGLQKASVIYVFPQNTDYKYIYNSVDYDKYEKVKNLLSAKSIRQGFSEAFPQGKMDLNIVYELTETTVGDVVYHADFHFNQIRDEYVVTKSDVSEKQTTIRISENIIYTTLNICCSLDCLMNYLYEIFDCSEVQDVPEWIEEVVFGDDLERKCNIESCENQIMSLQQDIKFSEEKLKENSRFKSILYTNSDVLVAVVYEILEKLLNCDLSNFVDKGREDFLIEHESEVFIGEIKGITSNVRNEFISQLDVHYQSYIDDHPDVQSIDHIHSLLIVNPFRNKAPKDREPINENQIRLAKRNGSLIIETVTLLKIFELFQRGEISSEECEKLFSSKTGLLKIEDFLIQ